MNADPTDLTKQFIARGVPTHLWIANPDGRLEYCNSGWCDFAGRTSEDMLLEGWPGLIHPDDVREFLQDWRTARTARQVFEKECRLIAADGAARRFFIHAEPLLDGHGKVANWHGLNTALPEPGESGSLDPENTAKAAAETIARVRSRMTASANHDLRQPLTALSFLADSLAKRLHDPISRDLLASMGRAIQSMRNVVEGQLYFDQVDSGRVEPSLVDHHVNASLIALAAEFNTMAERKGLGFVLHPSSACIRTDPALLDTVLKNLVSNALRYTVEGRVVVGCRRQGDWLRIEIHDTGRGIAADELGLIWQDFFRSSRSVQEYPGGYGLGLSIVKRLTDQLGHVVEVATKPGRGSCFAVKVPLADRAASPLKADRSAGNGKPLEGMRVLLLDKDPVTANSIRLLVEDWGGSVRLMPSVDDAAELLGQAGPPPHAVLADLRFGGASGGIVTMRQLMARTEQPVRGIILVEENTPVREREIALAGYRMIAKPIAPDALFHALR
jgi:signal transduction histidine kinase/CheY-like chemotaxis protein